MLTSEVGGTVDGLHLNVLAHPPFRVAAGRSSHVHYFYPSADFCCKKLDKQKQDKLTIQGKKNREKYLKYSYCVDA